MVPAEVIVGEITRMLRFPHPQVCRHYVASHLLSILEGAGYPVSEDLARAVVTADDETALSLLVNE